MSISEPFIRRPIATSLLMPNVDFPTITVTASLPGASPETMAPAVARPLEQQFSAVPGLAEMTSLSGVGTTTITLQALSDSARSARGPAQFVLMAAPPAERTQILSRRGWIE